MLSKSSGKEETITEVLQNRNSKKMAESIDEILNPVIHVVKLHMKRITLKKKKSSLGSQNSSPTNFSLIYAK